MVFRIYNYSVSNSIRKDRSNRILQPCINGSGYYDVNLYKKRKSEKDKMANAFIANTSEKSCIDHIGKDKLNNNIINLRWVYY